MARVLVEGVWFEQVEPSTFSEGEFEERVILHAPSVYPEYYVFPFKKTVGSEWGNAKPDLVFISKDYKEWRIVEVEMGYHNFSSHVEPQIQRLANAEYGGVGRYLRRQNNLLDIDEVERLITDKPPEILLIVNEPMKEWEADLKRHNAVIATFELFRSDDNKEVFRVDGEYPTQLIHHISECAFHQFIPRLLEVLSPGQLNLGVGEYIKLRFNNCVTEWQRTDAEGKVYLMPRSRSPVDARKTYEILRQGDSSLILRMRKE